MIRRVLYCLFLLLPAIWIDAAELRIHYDTGWGNRITLRGDGGGLNWQSGADAGWTQGNVWVLHTPNTGPGFTFKPLLNDTHWSVGANYQVPSADAVVDIFPFFGPAEGTLVVVDNFYSTVLNRSRALRIYLPPSYYENQLKSYPVAYAHDGQNLFDPATASFGVAWELDETADTLVAQGKMREVVFVGIDNAGAARIDEYTMTPDPTYGGGDGEAYLDFLEQEVLPYIESNYRVKAGGEHTTIMGSSLGGLISFCAAWTRPEVFGTAVSMSSSFWWDGDTVVEDVETYNGPFVPARFYLDMGAAEGALEQTNRMRYGLEQLGYQHGVNLWHWIDPNGGHNEASWRDRVHLPLEAVFPRP